ncbi:N-carbamoylsarcosine amidase [Fistulina hepatica ATCC 64428]|uniref:N-carbamoylsarcosine amidase n=1 Tax=Fistulina hepatica ATCC 64428 TaxID=1128425 RepID=A0A0D7AQB0_9AGAR|nr:N-carbamoylsarcosine amidase [Fistulina hepatica ATCC 64428]
MSCITHSESASYAASGFANVMGWGCRPALLIIDVCKAYWTPGSPLDLSANPSASVVPESIRTLLSAARAEHIPVFWSTVEYTHPDMADAGLFYLKSKVLTVWQRGDPRSLHEYVVGIEPHAGEEIVVKKYSSAFFGTSLASSLHVAGVDTVIICGVSTSGCVRATTLDAMQNGFRPMVVGSACGDRTQEIHHSNLFDLNAKYADVVSLEDAIAKMKELAGWRWH